MRQSGRRAQEGYHWFRRWSRPSAAQRRVLDELLAGGTNAEIAARLGLSEEGVRWHLNAVRSEAGIGGRAELAIWWQAERGRSHTALAPLLLLLRPLRDQAGPVAGLACMLAASLLLTLAVLGFAGRADEDGFAQGSSPPTRGPAAVVIAPTPTRVPQPGGAVIFDMRDASVSVLDGDFRSRRWLDPEAMAFLAIGPAGPLVVDGTGSAHDLIEPVAGAYLAAYAMPGGSDVILVNERTLAMSLLERASGAIRQLPPLEALPGADWSYAVSPAAARVAVARGAADGWRVLIWDIEGGPATELKLAQSLSQVFTDWSPDGMYLLLSLWPQTPSDTTSFRVVDAGGKTVREGKGSARWAASASLLVTASQAAAPGLVDLGTGATTAVEGGNRLLCVSPDGAYGIFWSGGSVPPFDLEARRLPSGAAVASIRLSRALIDCDWTADSTRAMLSPGGK